MQYNPGDGTGIVDEARKLVDATSNAYPIADITRRANIGLDKVFSLKSKAEGTWQEDDRNYDNLPIQTTDLISGQPDYALDDEVLEIDRIEVKDSGGEYHLIAPLDKSQIPFAESEFFDSPGQPTYYDKLGGSIVLYPATDYNSTSGLKVHYRRSFEKFDVADTTKSPGFPTPFHDLLAYYIALPYAMAYKKDRVGLLKAEIQEREAAITNHYMRRERDVKARLIPRQTRGE